MLRVGCRLVRSGIFFRYAATTGIYTLSLHDALPISYWMLPWNPWALSGSKLLAIPANTARSTRSEEHTSELQSLRHLVCRLLLEKKNGPGEPSLASATTFGSSPTPPRPTHTPHPAPT